MFAESHHLQSPDNANTGSFGNRTVTAEKLTPDYIQKELENSRVVDLKQIPREPRLKIINNFLASLNLRSIDSLGDGSKGYPEIVAINRYIPNNFSPRIHFQVEHTGEDGQLITNDKLCNFNANTATQSAAIIVPFVTVEEQRYLLVVRQFRDSIGAFTLEVPRGFPEKDDTLDPTKLKSIRELGEESVLDVESLHRDGKLSFRRLPGNTPEDSGKTNIVNSVYVVEINLTAAEFAKIQGKHTLDKDNGEQVGTFLIPLKDCTRFVRDQHSLSAIFLALTETGQLWKEPE